ncbi:MAG: hypothetical protein WCA07_00825 [Gloeobacterales cyanobacterium]
MLSSLRICPRMMITANPWVNPFCLYVTGGLMGCIAPLEVMFSQPGLFALDSVTPPDKVQIERLGMLEFFEGMPSRATV